MSAPANVTGDRLDQVKVGQQVHLSPVVLGAATPTTGWRTVTAVANTGAVVSLTFADGSYNGMVDQLVLIGWA